MPPVVFDRGRHSVTVPPHIRRSLAVSGLMECSALLRCNGRTRHIPTKAITHSEGSSGMYSLSLPFPPCTYRRLSLKVKKSYFFPSMLLNNELVSIIKNIAPFVNCLLQCFFIGICRCQKLFGAVHHSL